MPSAPKMTGSRNTQPSSKISERVKAEAAEISPFPRPVNHADVNIFSPQMRKLSMYIFSARVVSATMSASYPTKRRAAGLAATYAIAVIAMPKPNTIAILFVSRLCSSFVSPAP